MLQTARETEAPVVSLDDVCVRYPFAAREAVGQLSLELRRGERVLLIGPSGSGKSTLLLALTGIIPDHVPAKVTGRIALFGEPVDLRSAAAWSHRVALFFQDADQTLCGMRVEDEIAFALENRGLAEAEIHERIASVMDELKLPQAWLQRPSIMLSGGERQLVALASAVAQDADLFIADEPTAHLAPEAAKRFHRLVAEPRPGQTILVVDHRFDGLIEHIDRIVALGPDGAILADGPPRHVLRKDHARLRTHSVWTPPASELDARLAAAGCELAIPPLSVAEALTSLLPSESGAARQAVETFVADASPPARPRPDQGHDNDPVVRLDRAACAPFLSKPVLSEISLALYAGEIAALVGPNGAGKTTLGATLAGVLPVKAGRREGPPGGIAFQKAESQFLTGRVSDELAASLPKRMPAAEKATRVPDTLKEWDLGGFEERHPYELSEGQKRRLALASLTMTDRWPLIVLDEPTAGLDAAGAGNLAEHIAAMREAGKAVLLITHDLDFAARLADRLTVLAEGRILADGDPDELFADDTLMRRAGLKTPGYIAAARWLAERRPPC